MTSTTRERNVPWSGSGYSHRDISGCRETSDWMTLMHCSGHHSIHDITRPWAGSSWNSLSACRYGMIPGAPARSACGSSKWREERYRLSIFFLIPGIKHRPGREKPEICRKNPSETTNQHNFSLYLNKRVDQRRVRTGYRTFTLLQTGSSQPE